MSNNHKGFTLIECIIVVGAVLIIGAILIPRLQAVSGARVNAAARMIAADIRYAQSLAISIQKKHGIVFNAHPADTYFIYEQNQSNIIQNPFKGGNYTIQLNQGEFEGVIINGAFAVEFDLLGAPDSGGSVSISYNGSPPSRTISVASNTGQVTIN